MYIPSKLNSNIGISIIKRNSKISLCFAKNIDNQVKLIKTLKYDFKFPNPFFTNNASQVLEFMIEVNNYVKNNNLY